MEENHKLGLYVSYYLSRFDKQAYDALGFGNQKQTHDNIGRILDVKPATVKNWRDEFDPIHDARAGWYERSMNPSRVSVVEAMKGLNEEDIRGIVLDILNPKPDIEEINKLVAVISVKGSRRNFVPRGPTGKKAEQYFIDHHADNGLPYPGILRDTRENGCGFDFEIITQEKTVYIEVKGLATTTGGIVFTSKEWSTANRLGQSYYLVIIKNLDINGEIEIIQNPAEVFKPKKSIVTTIQVQWSLTDKELIRRIKTNEK